MVKGGGSAQSNAWRLLTSRRLATPYGGRGYKTGSGGSRRERVIKKKEEKLRVREQEASAERETVMNIL